MHRTQVPVRFEASELGALDERGRDFRPALGLRVTRSMGCAGVAVHRARCPSWPPRSWRPASDADRDGGGRAWYLRRRRSALGCRSRGASRPPKAVSGRGRRPAPASGLVLAPVACSARGARDDPGIRRTAPGGGGRCPSGQASQHAQSPEEPPSWSQYPGVKPRDGARNARRPRAAHPGATESKPFGSAMADLARHGRVESSLLQMSHHRRAAREGSHQIVGAGQAQAFLLRCSIGMAKEGGTSAPAAELTQSDFAKPLEALLQGKEAEAVAALVGAVALVYGGPLAGAAASGIVDQVARRVLNTATRRFVAAGEVWESEREKYESTARFVGREVAPQFRLLHDLLVAASAQERDQILEAQDEQFVRLIVFISKTVADAGTQAAIVRSQQDLRQQLAELLVAIRAVAPVQEQRPKGTGSCGTSWPVLRDTIELDRQLFQLPSENDDSDPEHAIRIARALHRGESWADVLQHRYVVVLGEAGTGKSTEFKRLAATMRTRGRWGFFVELNDLVNGDLDDAGAINDWRASGEDGTFFLDSLDEAKLQQGTLARALKNLQRALSDAWCRARVVVSCRASDWRSGADEGVLRSMIPPGRADNVYVVQLGPLEPEQVAILARFAGIDDVPAFCQAIDERHAQAFVERPIDVKWLGIYWKQHGRIAGLTELLEENVRVKLSDRTDRPLPFSLIRAQCAVKALAGIATLTRQHSFLVPDDSLQVSIYSKAIDAAKDVLPDWTSADVSALLRLPIFDESTYGRVRFHHRSVVEFLAAQWLRDLSENGLAPDVLQDILFREDSGGKIVPPHLAQVASWLCIWNIGLRETIIREAPWILIAHGDPAQLAPADRMLVLRSFAQAYLDRSRLFETFERASLERLSAPELADTIALLLGATPLKDELAETLLSIIEHGRVRQCVPQALGLATDAKRTLSVRSAAIAAVASAGTAEDRECLRSMAAGLDHCAPDLAAELVRSLYPNTLSVEELLNLLQVTQPPPEHVLGGLPMVLNYEVPTMGTPAARLSLLEGLVRLLSGAGEEGGIVAKGREWLVPGMGKLATAVINDSASAELLTPTVGAALEMANEHWVRGGAGRMDHREVGAALDRNLSLRQGLFWRRASNLRDRTGRMPTRYYELRFRSALFGIALIDAEWLARDARERTDVRERLLAFDALTSIPRSEDPEDRRTLIVRELVAEDSVLRTRYERMSKRSAFEAVTSDSHDLRSRARDLRDARLRDANRQYLEGHIAEISHGSNVGLLWWLLRQRGDPPMNWSEASILALQELYGHAVASAARVGWINFWRAYDPPVLNGESAEYAITDGVIVGLVGIAAEVDDGFSISSLDDDNTLRAIRYAAYEANGFPSWLSEIASTKPGLVQSAFESKVAADYRYVGQGAPAHDVLAKLQYATSDVRLACAPVVLRLLKGDDPPRVAALSQALSIASEAEPGGLRDELFEQRCLGAQSDAVRFAIWWESWLERAPGTALRFLEQHTSQGSFDAGYALVVQLCALLELHAEGLGGSETRIRHDREALSRLVPLVYEYVSPAADVDRVDDCPRERDRAQQLRSRLVRWLAAIPGPETADVLRRLAEDPRLTDHRDWLLHVRGERRSADADEETRTATQALTRLFRMHGLAALQQVRSLRAATT
jgi:hypothetical protein